MKRTFFKTSTTALLAGALLILGGAVTANATTLDFNFNSLSANATTAQIATYMDNAMAAAGCSSCTVTVYGATTDTTYDGDGHVVGPSGHPLTLGTYGGTPSAISNTATPTGVLGFNNLISNTATAFLADTNNSASQVGIGSHNEMYLKFNFPISGTVSFDYEIFPCATGFEGCTNPPDLTFEAGTGTSGSDPTIATFSGTTPSGSTQSADGPGETSKQAVGYYSTALSGDTELDFLDWPAAIGVDNLTITINTPESSSFLLLACGLVGLGLLYRKQLLATN
jgi:hypothetical protein